MKSDKSYENFLFPRWVNLLRPLLVVAVVGGLAYITIFVWYGMSAKTIEVGYEPVQPVPYSHALHVGQLGIDCRYCHTTVETAAHANVPPTQTCMNCHTSIRTKSEKLVPIRESYATGMPVEWIRVHELPGFVYFNHSAHVRRGIGCVSCHGRIDTMERVFKVYPMSMGWCLDCHRHPEKNLRPEEFITKLDWVPDKDQETLGAEIRAARNINPPQDCYTCHR